MNKILTISIGNDHAGFKMKFDIIRYLKKEGFNVINKGCDGSDSVDYPDYGHSVAQDVINNIAQKGIVICGSGNGINMSVNKHKGIRSALCWNKEIAELAVKHNNANIIALPARYISTKEAINCVHEFINNNFEGGRHELRVNKINF